MSYLSGAPPKGFQPLTIETAAAVGSVESARWNPENERPLSITGWVLLKRKDHELPAKIIARVGDDVVGASEAVLRPDVAAAFPESNNILPAGFDIRCRLLDSTATLVLESVSPDGLVAKLIELPISSIPGRTACHGNYARWALENHVLTPPLQAPSESLGINFSIVMPVYNPPREVLRSAVESVRNQTYRDWQLVIANDGSSDPHVAAELAQDSLRDERITTINHENNRGISHTLNEALAHAKFEWLLFLDHDDVLLPSALAQVAQFLSENPDSDVIYSDEEKITADGQSWQPFLKPGPSPIFLKGVMYPGHLLCVRKSVAQSAGALDPTFDGIQDYEFFLRLAEKTERISHLPEILYRWRMIPTSSAQSGNIKGDMDALQERAVNAHLSRLNLPGNAKAQSGHRILIEPNEHFTSPLHSSNSYTEAIKNPGPETAYHVLYSDRCNPPDDEQIRRLLLVARLAPGLVVVPTMRSSDDQVAESGCTIGTHGDIVPIMRGFDPTGDGYNGSLVCHREVLTASGHIAVIPAEVWSKLRPFLGEAFEPASFAEALITLEAPVIVCASVQCSRLEKLAHIPSRLTVDWPADVPTDPYWNPTFNPDFADYQLTPRNLEGFEFHLDESLPHRSIGGRITVSGWTFIPHDSAPELQLKIGNWTIAIDYGLPRPDVVKAYPLLPHHTCGFKTRIQLPGGSHEVEVRLRASAAGHWHTVVRQSIEVAAFRDSSPLPPAWVDSDLLAFQMGIHAAHPPHSIQQSTFDIQSDPANWPTLEVVTPNYNQGRFLPDVIHSLQTSHPAGLLHIIQDGKSTDNSVEVLRQYDSTGLRWHSESDDGQADAINRGFARNEGMPSELMAWINADDFYLPGTLDFVRDFFSRNPDVDLIYGNRIVVDESGLEINRWTLPWHDPEVLQLNDFIPQETMFWRRRIWGKIGGLDPRFQFALDWDFLLRAQSAGANIQHLPEFLGCFRVHSKQKTSELINTLGQQEIDLLRARTFGREILPEELLESPTLRRFLRKSFELENPGVIIGEA